MYWTGAGAVYVRARRVQGAAILMYHSVSREAERRFLAPESTMPLELFEEQMAFIARHRSVVSVADVVRAARDGRVFPAGTVALSFDDGYRDVLEVAAPVLARHRLPATLYLATGYVQREENQWVDELFSYFALRTRNALFLALPVFASHSLAEPENVDRVFCEVAQVLLRSAYSERRALLEDIRAQLAPSERAPRLTLTFDEVGRLVRDFPGISIGVHTRDHIDLTATSHEQVEAEIDACCADVRRELGISPTHFSYPYGRYCRVAARKLEELGFASACTTSPARVIDGAVDPFALPRFEAPQEMTLFRLRTSGAPERFGHVRRWAVPPEISLPSTTLQSGPRAASVAHDPTHQAGRARVA